MPGANTFSPETLQSANFASPLSFKFVVKRLPAVSYFAQMVELPQVSIPSIRVPSPFGNLPKPGNELEWMPLQLTFKVDERLQNYIELHTWLVAMGHPITFEDTKTFIAANPAWSPSPRGGANAKASDFVSDATLLIFTGQKNPMIEVSFLDAFPIQVSSLRFDATASDVRYLECTAIFSYRAYTFNIL